MFCPQDPKTNTALPQLREWAINVVDSYSGIPLSALAREELLKNPLPSKELGESHRTVVEWF